MPYAVGYARFSSTKQGKGSSLSRQQELISEWIENNKGYQIYPKKFEDLGRSASKGDHLKHGFGKLLEAIEQGEIKEGDVILVEAIDRIGRLPEMQMISLIDQIVSAKVQIITLQDGCTYGPIIKSEQIWSLVGKVQQAYMYSASLSERVKASYKRREALAMNGVIPKRRTPIWLNSDGTVKPDIAEAMKGAFEDALSGIGERRILKRLIQSNTAFETINPSTIRRWLTNRIAIGYWKDYKIYPSIVSDELFYQVQKRFNDEYKPPTAPRTHFLSGLIKCGDCGANMQVKINKNSPFTMRCTTRCVYGDLRCKNSKSFPVPVLLHVCYDTATGAVEKAMQNIELSSSQKKLIVIDGQLRDVSEKISNIVQSLEKYGPLPELDRKIASLSEQRNKLEREKLLITNDTVENVSKYDTAWDYQYELIADHPMRLNALLQSSGYQIDCYSGGLMLANTSGNDFSECVYEGYNRKIQAYKISAQGNVHHITNRDGSLTKERLERFKTMLARQRTGDTTTFKAIETSAAELEMYEFYNTI
ncbi:recombinase family protein [Pseudomonas fluorescens]|uniref:recombinase family protein n=1 Tax=Pseudomonas fluorescens TaxID=294 RepID=UPI000F472165|nr:recombinase family protein [Pseudomonas fluorescens]